MIHEVDITPQEYARIVYGSRTFLIRPNDGFQFGDDLVLKEFDPSPINSTSNEPKGYTGSDDLSFQVGYIEVLPDRTLVISLIPEPAKPAKKTSKKKSKTKA